MAEPSREFATALVWLTRLPMRRVIPVPLARAVWAFPLVGLVVALLGSVTLIVADALALSDMVAALLALAVMALATGALHEDGLADYADGCGGATRERALAIMRDSRIGSYGVLALIFSVGLKVAALADTDQAALALIAAAALSRAGMGAGLRWLPPARSDGLGRLAGRPTTGAVWTGLAIGAALAALCGFGAAVLAVLACGTAQALVARNARRRLGGQTGDVLGAMQQVGEVAALLALSTVL
ncbi:adenosylcobinamide-GDP ribazoletransferase [Paracoccus laeviglucosivorans]|uniref:Adenosylcobinamide-GDP ribazoletransferase n=1 Tax=Paracoccus laeviglucosivorans TaxID=1197861 RepID=A0A521BUI5_9RHOB|nr:adenosylcobinamide-GDP ribazoletransferase [Paracoccus laeviglucosivorans]SMO50816.1 cobalamin-5'-phosphate synthase [Paracoccus laeviglucosivorans]